jgi:hypothetical protein
MNRTDTLSSLAWLRRAPLLFVLLSVRVADAQGPTPPAPQAPAVEYQSIFDRYLKYVEQPVAAWRESNDNVGRVGGWRAYAREAHRPDVPDAIAPAPASTGGGVAK